MRFKNCLIFIFVFLLLSSLLCSQSLIEIAKKERERRASLKGKKVTVVTNADLAKLKKKAAIEIPRAHLVPETEESKAPDVSAPLPETPEQAFPPELQPESANATNLKTLQERYEKAKEYVELLTLKMGALWQQFYSLGDMTSKDSIQQAIGETFLKLERAQEDETKARQELEKFLSQTKKDSAPPLWIR